MQHLGDITNINGYNVPVVDCVIGGSPCQGLSVAGKRAGLDDERSGLFMEQIRIIKEMRENDRSNGRTGTDVRPRYMVWENVWGVLSSPGGDRKGEDFRAVLEETLKVVDSGVYIPRPNKGKWPNAGCIMGKQYSLAWRVMDAQFHGTPQRRRRIHLVCDFNGTTAPEIVFEHARYRCERSADTYDSEPLVGHTGEQPQPKIQPLNESLSGHTKSCIKRGKDLKKKCPILWQALCQTIYRDSVSKNEQDVPEEAKGS